MGARQSKRSVDITTTPKKGEGEVAVEGEGKLEKIADIDGKITTNGVAHDVVELTSEKELAAKVENELKESTDEIKENGVSDAEESKEVAEPKTPEAPVAVAEEDTAGGDQATVAPTLEKTPESGDSKIEETPDSKKKDKSKKKKWSFRSISFSKKDKSKPNKEAEKNGEVKEVAEENVEETVASPVVESPKGEEVKTPEVAEAAAPLANGSASAEELVKPEEAKVAEEPAKPAEEPPKAVEEPPKAVEEPPKPVVEEAKAPEPPVAEPPQAVVEEPKKVEAVAAEESKEVPVDIEEVRQEGAEKTAEVVIAEPEPAIAEE